MRARHPKLNRAALAMAGLLATLAATPASAASCTWNTTNGNWNAILNWTACVTGNGNPAGAPGAADTATIGAAGVVTINTGQSVLNLNNAGQITIDAFGLNLVGGGGTVNTGIINIGGTSTANLGVSGGHNITNTGGVINIASGSVLNQFGSSITGGTINTTGTGALVAFNSGSNFLSNVTLNGVLDLASNLGIQRITGGLALNGTVNIGSNSIFSAQGNQTISGNGNIVFADANGSNRFLVEAGNLTLGSGISVSGGNGTVGGQLFSGGAATLTNQGTINASVSGRSITVDVNGLVTNNGTLKATNGGTLVLNNNAGSGIAGAAGTVLADVGSTVLMNGVAITGGSVNSTGTGRIVAANNGNNFLNGATLNGIVDMASNLGQLRVSAGGMTLNGRIDIGSNSIFAPQGNQTIGGSGNIVFADANGSNRFNVEAGNLVLGSGITVRGNTGIIGQQVYVGGAATLTNNGTVQADVAGGTITIGVSGAVTNNGTFAALNGGTLLLNSSINNASGSVINAGAASTVIQNGVVLNGAINVTGGGNFRPANSGVNFLDAASFTGVMDMASAQAQQRVTNGLVLNGTVNLGLNSIFGPQGNQTISGNGNIVFADGNGSNRLNVEAGNLVLGSGITVRGRTGIIGQQAYVGGAATLTNNGTIQADVAGGTITLAVNGTVTNNGTFAALNGGTLLLNNSINNTSGSVINAGAASTVIQNGVVLNGAINVTGGGNFRPANSGSNFLNAASFTGVMDMASAQAQQRVTGGLVLNGTVNLGNNSILGPQGDQTFSGSGNIVFADGNGSNRFTVEAGNLTLASGISVSGGNGTVGGQVYLGGAATLTNQGLINASVAARSITVDVNGLVTNTGTMKATNGATLLLNSNAGAGIANAGGTILADVGSTVLMNGVAITGGTVNSTGTGRIVVNSNGNNFLNGVTLNGVVDMASNQGQLRVSAGGMVLNGRIDIGNNSILAPQGNQMFTGTGNIVFTDANGSNRFNVEAGNLVLDSGITVSGNTGYIGLQTIVGGAANLTSNGTINSSGGGTITVNVNGALVNNGLLRAQSGSLLVQDTLTGSGTLRADVAGSMQLANGGNAQGVLMMGAAGAALNIGTGNLTLGSDYTNGAWGSGNSFVRRAGITGTGLILAGGNAAMNFTGAGVTGGATGNATLTIGNVRVGANTFNYQLANVGTTGPTLRGAIQTSVNGGNLTDGRLSGAGVAASNFSAGAPGSNSGNLGITFTAGAAGVLAPLTGQVLNLRSNFENIGDQKLNIVLGAGAAAFNAAVGSATPSPVNLAAQRVGGMLTTALTVANTAPAGAYSEDLNASFSGFTGSATGSGSISGRLAGPGNTGTGTGSMVVGVDTSNSGAKSGSVTLAYATAGAVNGVSNGLGTAPAGTQTINVTGNVYAPAVVQLNTATVNFGTVRVGDSVTPRTVSVSNGASGALTDTLRATLGGGAAPFGTAGTATGIAAGSSNNTSLTVGLSTLAAGVFNGNGTVTFTSQNPEMADLGLGTANVSLLATVNNIAAPALAKTSGAGSLSGSAPNYTLSFGTLLQGSGTVSTLLSLANSASGPADALAGSFALGALAGTPFSALSGFGNFSGVAGGSSLAGGLSVGFNTSTLGNFNSTITLNPRSTNSSQADLALGAITLTLQGNVAAVPEPGTWALWLAGLAVLGGLARRQSAQRA